jgi:hypothetical protein
MAAREDQPESIVVDRHLLCLLSRLGRRQFLFDELLTAEALGLLDEPARSPQAVDGTIPGGRRDPRARVRRNAVPRPPLQRSDERVLDRFLGEVEVPD